MRNMEKIQNNSREKSRSEKRLKLLPISSHPSATSSRNGKIGSSLFFSLLLPSQKSQTFSMFNFHVFLLQKTFLNACYCLLLVPFRFATKSRQQGSFSLSSRNEYFLQSCVLQQILSTILILTLITYSLLDIRSILASSLEERPEKAFIYADTLCLRFFPLFWMVTFWWKRKHFVKLLAVCQGAASQSLLEDPVKASLPKAPLTWLINLVFVSAIIKVVYTLVSLGYNRTDAILCTYGGQALYTLHLRDKLEPLSFQELYASNYMFGGSMIASIISTILLLMEEFFDMFCVIGAVMMYAICCHFFNKVEKLTERENPESGLESQSLMQTLRELSRNYMDLVNMSDIINDMFGTPVVLYYLSSYPTLVWMVFALFKNNDDPAFVLYCTHKIVIFIIFNAVASEGCSKVQRYKLWLFETSVSEFLSDNAKKSHFILSNEGESRSGSGWEQQREGVNSIQPFLNIMHRQVNCEDVVGLKGYKFFTVTYKLIGTMLGFIVTFAIVMLQFESDKKDGCNSTLALSTPASFQVSSVDEIESFNNASASDGKGLRL